MRRSLLTLALFCLAGCTNFSGLQQDRQEARASLGYIAGELASETAPNRPTIVVTLAAPEAKRALSYRVYERAGAFAMTVPGAARYLFAFNDLNHDFNFQENEPSAWLELPEHFGPGQRLEALQLVLGQAPGGARPAFGNLFDMRGMPQDSLHIQLGTLIDLSAPRFDDDLAGIGLWMPLHFVKEGYAGIYFLEKYAAEKTPVLFVHGLNGSPRNFATLIGSIDRQRFQPWLLYYPSGLELSTMGDALAGMLAELQLRYQFKDLHIIAHSMGGLVSRSYLNSCSKNGNCSYLRTYTSLSSPFGGDSAAQSGLTFAPEPIPVWHSMVPGGRFLSTLFSETLPNTLSHQLLFGYRNTSFVRTNSSDGTISLTSQLRREAQLQASRVIGYDEDHMSILDAQEVHRDIKHLLEQR